MFRKYITIIGILSLVFLTLYVSAGEEDCQESKDNAESYRDELESYTKRLYRCIQNNDLTDDCYSEFRRVKSAHSDFESAVSDVGSNCE